MNLSSLMDELGDVLDEVPGLRVYRYPQSRIAPPAAIVAWPDIDYDLTFQRGADSITFPLYVAVSMTDPRAARDQLAAYLRGDAPDPAITIVGTGTGAANADSGAGATVTPALPVEQIDAGDLLLCLASVRNADTGTIDTPAGWTLLHSTNTFNMRLFGKVAAGGGTDTPPTVAATSGGTSITLLAQCAALRGTSTNLATIVQASNVQSFGAAVNLPFAALTFTNTTGAIGIRAGWRQDDWTSVADVSNFTRIGSVNSTLGNDAAQIWDLGRASWTGGSWVITGGTGQSRALSCALAAGDPETNRSIKALIEAHTYTHCDFARVQRAETEVIAVGDVEYLAAKFTVETVGTGSI